MDHVAVKVVVILAGLEPSILFLDEEERRSLGGFGRMDFPERRFSSINSSAASLSLTERG